MSPGTVWYCLGLRASPTLVFLTAVASHFFGADGFLSHLMRRTTPLILTPSANKSAHIFHHVLHDIDNSSQHRQMQMQEKQVSAPFKWKITQHPRFSDHIVTNNTLLQAPATFASESWSVRLEDAMVIFLMGCVLVIFGIHILWWSEHRNAIQEGLLSCGQSQCLTVTAKSVDTGRRNSLVHIQGAPMTAAGRIWDAQFDVQFESGCVLLRSEVQAFQHIQHEQIKTIERLGGGKETITTYEYTHEWSTRWHDSSRYPDPKYQNRNQKPAALQLGQHSRVCSRVEYGDSFLLTAALLKQCVDFKSATDRLGPAVLVEGTKVQFRKGQDGWFYFREDVEDWQGEGEPKVGDCRVHFDYVPDGPASVMALQVADYHDNRDTFLPYRLISRGLCGTSWDKEKIALKIEAEKTPEQLALEESPTMGLCSFLCCSFNLLATYFPTSHLREINYLYQGDVSKTDFFDIIKTQSTSTWGLRSCGRLLIFVGSYMIFSPLTMLMPNTPLIGPMLASCGSAMTWVACLMATFEASCIIGCIAYLAYHPKVAQLYFFAACVAVVLPLAITKCI